MFAFFRMVALAIARALGKGLDGLDWCWRQFCGLLPGGGGGTAMPPAKLDLPDVEDAHEAQAEAKDQQRAADYILSSPERVAQAWAQASPKERDTIPLTRLTPDQIDWLEVHLSNDQLKILASEKSERKIAQALAGYDDVIIGLPSVGQIKRKKSATLIADRIAAFRNGGLERPPAFVH